MVQDHLAGARVVKAFNHIPAAAILTDGAPAGTPGRRARDRERPCGCRGPRDRRLRRVRLDTVDIGSVAESWRVERDQPAYVVRQDADELRANLARATR
jgi:predicted dinucleotide-binding enzyme